MRVKVGSQDYVLGFRYDAEYVKSPHDSKPMGLRRLTWAYLKLPDGTPVVQGYAVCSPLDQFNKSTGRKVALSNALRNVPRHQRREVWRQYWQRVPLPAA